eukprot:TRINITY_DN2451_c0_g1_i1.p1 TRINITY_DN2451_c0_g1~~TRINITY_DN2451_c0_g1_i1.p1  ORF type:complete len:280 (+),score=38.54 TRINITY_DN2451_c0_g1_i1:49-840(+)
MAEPPGVPELVQSLLDRINFTGTAADRALIIRQAQWIICKSRVSVQVGVGTLVWSWAQLRKMKVPQQQIADFVHCDQSSIAKFHPRLRALLSSFAAQNVFYVLHDGLSYPFAIKTSFPDVCDHLKINEEEFILSQQQDILLPVENCLPGRLYYLQPRPKTLRNIKRSVLDSVMDEELKELVKKLERLPLGTAEELKGLIKKGESIHLGIDEERNGLRKKLESKSVPSPTSQTNRSHPLSSADGVRERSRTPPGPWSFGDEPVL